jgi:hypothetical protein
MVLWGLADYFVDEIVEFYPSREAAEAALYGILRDEPEWHGMMAVLPVTLIECCPN